MPCRNHSRHVSVIPPLAIRNLGPFVRLQLTVVQITVLYAFLFLTCTIQPRSMTYGGVGGIGGVSVAYRLQPAQLGTSSALATKDPLPRPL